MKKKMRAFNMFFFVLLFYSNPSKAQDYVFKVLTEDDIPIPIFLLGEDQDIIIKIKPDKDGQIKLSKEFLAKHKSTEFTVMFDPGSRALPYTYRRDLFYQKNSENCIPRNRVILDTIVQKKVKVLYIKYLTRNFVPPETIGQDSM